jgi:hypothetical protein
LGRVEDFDARQLDCPHVAGRSPRIVPPRDCDDVAVFNGHRKTHNERLNCELQ